MAAKITKSDEAPEGLVKFSVGSETGRLDDENKREFVTDDRAVIEFAEASRFFNVEPVEDEEETVDAREEHKAVEERKREEARADKQRAEKDPREAPAPKPTGPEVRS